MTQQIRLLVQIPYRMVKDIRKRWPWKESSVHMLCPSLATPLTGTLGVSWHWQVGIIPQQGSPFGGCLQSLWGTMKLQSWAHQFLHAQIRETPQGWWSFTRPLSHSMYFWDRMVGDVSSPRHETIDKNTGLLSYYTPKVWEKKKKVSLRGSHFEERQIPKQIHSFINIA